MDFAVAEYETRTANAQAAMRDAGVDALLLTTEPDVRYFSGFRTLFWLSPTRPWFLIIPADGKPIAIIPQIGAALMRETWLDDIRVWGSPAESDDGLSLLADALAEHAAIGMPMGRESALRMPLADFENLRERLRNARFVDASPMLQALRFVKSEAEIDVIRTICGLACNAFEAAPRLFHKGQTMADAFRAFKIELLNQGADDVPYLVGGKGPDGYADVISPPSQDELQSGDVFMLDTGATLTGYFCDFDRNFAVGAVSDAVKRSHDLLWQATQAGLDAARPGATCADLFAAMQGVIGGEGGGDDSGEVGRLGHGLGMQLTEHPSIIGWDKTVMREGAVMTLEPSLSLSGGGVLVHEENIVIRDGAPELLTRRAPRELPVI